jgi:3-dehydroquinate dehydratase-1
MEQPHPRPAPDRPLVVGCLSSAEDLAELDPSLARSACDLVEIRLDGLHAGGNSTGTAEWAKLSPQPLLFTARRGDEGGAGDLDGETRAKLLRAALVDADWIDIEAASLDELGPVAQAALENGVGLVVSFHDFHSVPDEDTLHNLVGTARDAGATVAKIAATPGSPAELARLAGFTARDHGIAISTMGMGPLAVASRLLCAQCGSVLNYGFLGSGPTAPGQWSAARLRDAISTLPQLRESS